jgi:hypothetical protein
VLFVGFSLGETLAEVLDKNPASVARQSRGARDPLSVAMIVILVTMLALDSSRFGTESRFFSPTGITNADGSAPVLQDSRRSATIDADFRAAASFLPRSATCVIATDSWHEDYFRASYIMMPLRVWPYAERALTAPSTLAIAAAMATHHATCALLAPTDIPPRGLRRITRGDYSLYIMKATRTR